MDAHQLVGRVHEVCPLPAATQRVINLAGDPQASLKEVAEAVAVDPALAAEVLRIANSAAYGRVRGVSDLAEAVLTIGLGELHSMASAMAMLAAFRSDQEQSLSIHETAVVAGALGRQLAPAFGADPRPAFLCGLLAEIGALACLAVDAEVYCQLWTRTATDPGKRRRREVEAYGQSSRWIGGQLLRSNDLPEPVAQAVAAEDDDYDISPLGRTTRFCRRAAYSLIEAGHDGDSDQLAENLGQAAFVNSLEVDPRSLVEAALQAGATAQKALTRSRS